MALYTKVAETRERVLIPCTVTQAASLRGDLYAFRRAAENDLTKAQQLGIDVPGLRDVAFRVVKGEGLEAIHQSTLLGPGLIEAALGGNLPPVEGPAEKSLRLLREKLAKPEAE
jgi:hypothetical protein